ncbi:MAG: response regulator [Desulfobacterales bacterium]|nr:response regulator [Desulfobacterales bacterium]
MNENQAKKIMIVDDDPAITRYLDVLFQDHGYRTCIADDGRTAMDLFKAESPDLITLDLEMPEEWGPRFFRKLSKIKGFSTPVIVISGLSGRQYSIPKADAFFAKPFDKDALLAEVKRILTG